MRSVVLLSGGLDSAVAAALEQEQGHEVFGLCFRYGQRHAERENEAAETLARLCGWPLRHGVLAHLTGSTLTDAAGSLTDASVVVPCRNLLLLTHAAAYAVSLGAERVVIGSHAGDHALFPDCRPEFFAALNATLWLSECGVKVHSPFAGLTKAQVVSEGVRLGVPLWLTWSCYTGGPEPCGECLACRERAQAFAAVSACDCGRRENQVEREVVEGVA